MELHQLRMFALVAEEGNFTRAAERLHCVQPNVTSWIKRLEKELKIQLFIRQKRGAILTAAGKTMLGYTVEILRLTEDCKKALQDSPIPTGTIQFGALESTTAVRLPPVLIAYRNQYPDVELELITGTTRELINNVLACRLDGALVGGFSTDPRLHQEAMLNEEIVMVCSNTLNPLIDVAELLERQPIIVCREGCFYRSRLEQWLYDLGVLCPRVREVGTLDGILACVTAGMGVTIMARSLVEGHYLKRSLRFRSLPDRIAHMTTVFIRRKDAVETSAMRALLGLLRKYLQRPHLKPVVAKRSAAVERYSSQSVRTDRATSFL